MRPSSFTKSFSQITGDLCVSLVVASAICLCLVHPTFGQQEQQSSYQGGAYPSAPSVRAPLQGQVEESTTAAPDSPYRPALPGNIQQDPFTQPNQYQYQPGAPQYDYGAVPPPVNPRTPSLKALLQNLMAIQGQQQEATMAPPAVRPNWLPAYAYTNDYMVAPYHNLDIAWWDKRRMPDQKKWIKLSNSVTKYWKGFVPEPCMVLIVPLSEAPGNFSFNSPARSGPSGWLQFTGVTDRMGFPLYRYWFGRP